MKKLLLVLLFPIASFAQTPSVSFGPAAGIGPYGITIFGNDSAGIISFMTGNAGLTGKLFTVTFYTPYPANVIADPFLVNEESSPYYYRANTWCNTRFADHFDVYTGHTGMPIPANTLVQIGYIVK